MSYSTDSSQSIYQSNPQMVSHLKQTRDQLQRSITPYMNRRVRVLTIDHVTYEGTIMHMDQGHLYIKVSPYQSPASYRSYAYNSVILPLVLFELLVITLLS